MIVVSSFISFTTGCVFYKLKLGDWTWMVEAVK